MAAMRRGEEIFFMLSLPIKAEGDYMLASSVTPMSHGLLRV